MAWPWMAAGASARARVSEPRTPPTPSWGLVVIGTQHHWCGTSGHGGRPPTTLHLGLVGRQVPGSPLVTGWSAAYWPGSGTRGVPVAWTDPGCGGQVGEWPHLWGISRAWPLSLLRRGHWTQCPGASRAARAAERVTNSALVSVEESCFFAFAYFTIHFFDLTFRLSLIFLFPCARILSKSCRVFIYERILL